MEWSQLSTEAANILERCWFSVRSDRATSFSVKIGEKLYSDEDVVTIDTLHEIFEFQKTNPHFNVKFSTYDQVIHVCGAFEYYEWNGFDNTLTESGRKTKLEVGDVFYVSYSDDMARLEQVTVEKITSKNTLFSSGHVIPTNALNEIFSSGETHLTHKDSDTSQSFFFRQSNRMIQAFERQLLVDEFNNLFELKSISDDNLRKMIALLKEAEIEHLDDSKKKKATI